MQCESRRKAGAPAVTLPARGLLGQPLLEERHAEARLALELLRILVAVREDDGRLDADERETKRPDLPQERGVARDDPRRTRAGSP